LREVFISEFGEEEFEKLSYRLKKLFVQIDSLPTSKRPVPKRQLEAALG